MRPQCGQLDGNWREQRRRTDHRRAMHVRAVIGARTVIMSGATFMAAGPRPILVPVFATVHDGVPGGCDRAFMVHRAVPQQAEKGLETGEADREQHGQCRDPADSFPRSHKAPNLWVMRKRSNDTGPWVAGRSTADDCPPISATHFSGRANVRVVQVDS